jgi:hypothetical protein
MASKPGFLPFRGAGSPAQNRPNGTAIDRAIQVNKQMDRRAPRDGGPGRLKIVRRLKPYEAEYHIVGVVPGRAFASSLSAVSIIADLQQ